MSNLNSDKSREYRYDLCKNNLLMVFDNLERTNPDLVKKYESFKTYFDTKFEEFDNYKTFFIFVDKTDPLDSIRSLLGVEDDLPTEYKPVVNRILQIMLNI